MSNTTMLSWHLRQTDERIEFLKKDIEAHFKNYQMAVSDMNKCVVCGSCNKYKRMRSDFTASLKSSMRSLKELKRLQKSIQKSIDEEYKCRPTQQTQEY